MKLTRERFDWLGNRTLWKFTVLGEGHISGGPMGAILGRLVYLLGAKRPPKWLVWIEGCGL